MLDPNLLQTFRARIRNPLHWRNTHRILHSYSRRDLATPLGAGTLVGSNVRRPERSADTSPASGGGQLGGSATDRSPSPAASNADVAYRPWNVNNQQMEWVKVHTGCLTMASNTRYVRILIAIENLFNFLSISTRVKASWIHISAAARNAQHCRSAQISQLDQPAFLFGAPSAASRESGGSAHRMARGLLP